MTDNWPHETDKYRAAWADVFRYAPNGSWQTSDGRDLLDAIAEKYGLDLVAPWTRDDPVDERISLVVGE